MTNSKSLFGEKFAEGYNPQALPTKKDIFQGREVDAISIDQVSLQFVRGASPVIFDKCESTIFQKTKGADLLDTNTGIIYSIDQARRMILRAMPEFFKGCFYKNILYCYAVNENGTIYGPGNYISIGKVVHYNIRVNNFQNTQYDWDNSKMPIVFTQDESYDDQVIIYKTSTKEEVLSAYANGGKKNKFFNDFLCSEGKTPWCLRKYVPHPYAYSEIYGN
jgi:hypothetical protein